MATQLHPLATDHLPYFVTPPGSGDQMLLVVAAVWVVAVLALGGLYFWLHSLPDRIAHNRRRRQLELVAVLGIIALFTHNNLFWVAALILAMIDLPVISAPLARIAEALESLSVRQKDRDLPPDPPRDTIPVTPEALETTAVEAAPAAPAEAPPAPPPRGDAGGGS